MPYEEILHHCYDGPDKPWEQHHNPFERLLMPVDPIKIAIEQARCLEVKPK